VHERAEPESGPVEQTAVASPVSMSAEPVRSARSNGALLRWALSPPSPGRAEIEAGGATALARAVAQRRGAAAPGLPVRRLLRIFEKPAAKTAGGIRSALDDFRKLSPADRKAELAKTYPTGELTVALAAFGSGPRLDPANADLILEILRWVEETEVHAATGKTDKELAKLQADFLKAQAEAKKKPPKDWGGAPPGKTRFAKLLPAEKILWTDRGQKAIKKMAAYTKAKFPELKVTEATFELEFDAVDAVSLGAIATVGSKEGQTVRVGFEFVTAVEMDPAYALSTVVHELYGHPAYDPGSTLSYSVALYQKAAAAAPVTDKSGVQTYGYWPTEMYSLLKEFPYWTEVTAADKAKPVALPGSATTMDQINYDPRGAVGGYI
jgi:hypothetical protein